MKKVSISSVMFVFALSTSMMLTATSAVAALVPATETFSGLGSETATGGPGGFEEPGWTVLGATGSFQTNSNAEQVYAVTSIAPGGGVSFDGLERVIGDGPFTALLEISNPVLPAVFGTTGLTISDGPDNNVAVGVQQLSSGTINALVSYSVGGGLPQFGPNLPLGSNVNQITLRLQYAPDLVNGGGLFTADVDVNESGSFTTIGSIDGTEYSVDAIVGRTASPLVAASLGNTASAEFDLFSIVPEPSSMALAVLALLGAPVCFRRRKR